MRSWALSKRAMKWLSLNRSSTSKCAVPAMQVYANPRRYISNIEMPGGTIRYVPLHPPADGATRTSSAGEWSINFEEFEGAINPKTKMIVSTPYPGLY